MYITLYELDGGYFLELSVSVFFNHCSLVCLIPLATCHRHPFMIFSGNVFIRLTSGRNQMGKMRLDCIACGVSCVAIGWLQELLLSSVHATTPDTQTTVRRVRLSTEIYTTRAIIVSRAMD